MLANPQCFLLHAKNVNKENDYNTCLLFLRRLLTQRRPLVTLLLCRNLLGNRFCRVILLPECENRLYFLYDCRNPNLVLQLEHLVYFATDLLGLECERRANIVLSVRSSVVLNRYREPVLIMVLSVLAGIVNRPKSLYLNRCVQYNKLRQVFPQLQ